MRACLFAIIATTLGCSVQPTPWPQTMATEDGEMELWADGGTAWVDSESTETDEPIDSTTEEAKDEPVDLDTESDSESTAMPKPTDSTTQGADSVDTETKYADTGHEYDDTETMEGGEPCKDAEQYDPPNGIDDDCDGLVDEEDTVEQDTVEIDTCGPCELSDPGDGIDNDCDGWIDEIENDTNCEEE